MDRHFLTILRFCNLLLGSSSLSLKLNQLKPKLAGNILGNRSLPTGARPINNPVFDLIIQFLFQTQIKRRRNSGLIL